MLYKFIQKLEEEVQLPVFLYIDNVTDKITFNKDSFYVEIKELNPQSYFIKGGVVFSGDYNRLYQKLINVVDFNIDTTTRVVTDVSGFTFYQEFTYLFPPSWLEIAEIEVIGINNI